MKTLHLSVISGLMIFFLILPNTVFAHTIPSPFISSTDKTEYDIGETIKISGNVANEIIKPHQPVRIQIFSPDGTQYDDVTVNLEQHGSYSNGYYNYGYTFSYDLKIKDGALAGNYQIMAYYDNSLESSYTITYDKSHTNFDQYFVYNMYVNNKTYPIRYKLTEGNEIQGISGIDIGNNFFNMAVRGIENKTGQIIVELPRQIIDSKYGNSTDKNFTVAMGGSGGMIGYAHDFKEIQKNAENRILQFDIVPQNVDYLIFVYGTQSLSPSTIMQNNHMLSPLKQFKSGISSLDVKCDTNYVLIIKSEDGSPACVKPDTATKLVERGWTKMRFATGITINSYTPISNDTTYLSETVDEWKNKTHDQLDAYYKKYKDTFYDELGSFLIKDEMKKELARQNIQNVHDDFKVFPGMSLDSLPPHISYDAVVNATDGNSYLLLGGVFANKIESSPKIIKLVFDKNALHSLNTGNGPSYPDPSTNAHVNNSTSQERVQIAGTYIENSDIPWSSVGTGNYGVIQIGLYTSVYHMIPDAQKYYTVRAMQLIPFYVQIKILPPPSAAK